ncbi:cytochrome P450 [Wolfiporia cocos MD-104 SS10]|uniref:Cytochrome P450 n=1 Tax=Wolfiporia cocos (strain MD-104) TaxID=742152 RepID=A0A2H3JKD7_WOLCO|nr:cytochrome P450 [Wolfiporia cocos MD-104 SS10]
MSKFTDAEALLGSLARPLESLGYRDILFAISCLITYYIGTVILRRRTDSPPGPLPLPFIGNVLQVPTEKSWIYFSNLCKKYGSIVKLTFAGRDMIILNDIADIDELLVKRSGNFSSRQQLVYAGKYRSKDKRLVLLPYGPLLKRQRAAVFQMLNAKVVGAYEGIQERGALKLLSDILENPTKAYISVKWFTAETLLMLVYGKKFDNEQDLRTLLHILETFIQDIHPARYLVDTLPVLDWLPDMLAPWRAEACKKHTYEIAFYSRLLQEVKERMDKGEPLECFAARLWEDVEKNGLDEISMAYVAGSAFEAGTDNTAGTILWFLVAMLHSPDAMKKAQAELDRVLGPEGHTPPSFKNLQDLPYCAALVKEVFRWMPVAPVGGPHVSLKDDTYKGYQIAASTTIMPNVWAVHHNETDYPDAFKFRPERFVPAVGSKVETEYLNEGHYGFGFGRRTCPGQYLASKSVWIGIVNLLWAFDICPPIDKYGNAIIPDAAAVRNGITAEPGAFDVILTPRSGARAQTIISACG